MNKSKLHIILWLLISLNMAGCSLFSSSGDGEESATISETEGDELANDDFETGKDLDAEAEGEADGVTLSEDEYADDNFDQAPQDGETSEDGLSISVTGDESETGSDGELPDETMTSNQEGDLFGAEGGTTEPMGETSGFADNTEMGGAMETMDAPVSEKKLIPVKKMKPAAYLRAGANVNRLYVVRSGENMETIAEKLYGDNSQAQLLYSYNPHFQGKDIHVGDKIYYESPLNKTDQSMMTYYEDNNMEPSYYTTQEGDNIRQVAQKLLGHPRSWMEIYATNANVDSKGRLPAGVLLRYWPTGAGPGSSVAMGSQSMDEEGSMAEGAEEAFESEMDTMGQEPSMDMNGNMGGSTEVASMNDPGAMGNQDLPPPPPSMGSMNDIPPPPPQPMSPPPMPENNGPIKKFDPMRMGGEMGNDDGVIMGALGGLLVLAAIIMLVFIRRNRSKRVQFSQTQI